MNTAREAIPDEAAVAAGMGPTPAMRATGAAPWPTDGMSREALRRYGKDVIRQTLPFTVEDRRRSWLHFWASLAALAITGIAAALPMWWPLRAICSVLLGLSLVRTFVLYHDYMHGAILSGSRFADVFFKGFSLMVLAPPTLWRQSHDYHHGHSGQYVGAEHGRLPLLSTHTDIGAFPLMSTAEYARANGWKRLRYRVARNPLMIALAWPAIFMFSICLVSFVTQPRHRRWSALALTLNVLMATAMAVYKPDALIFSLLIPSLFGSALGAYMFYCQHNFPGARYLQADEWDYVATAVHSSSFMRTGPVMGWFTANIGYHHVHHANSGIPFYRLPEAMQAITALQDPYVTSLHPREIARCLSLKLWDGGRGRMVSMREYHADQRARAAATDGERHQASAA